MKVTVHFDKLKLREVFTISRGSRTHADVLRVEISGEGATGNGECVPYARYGETLESVQGQIEGLPPEFDRAELQSLLPAGAARNAVDCALWDLEAKAAGKRAWDIAQVSEPKSVTSVYTLSLGTPDAMRAQAARQATRPILKTKLGGGSEDVDRIQAVRDGAPDARIVVDANEGWTLDEYKTLVPIFSNLGVEMIEQPFPSGEDAKLADVDRPIPICADESCHDRASLAGLKGLYDTVNIKLDKTGGLTEALALKSEAIAMGFDVMVGCMVGSSLAMAPAMIIAQDVKLVDLDGPLLLAEDRDPPLAFEGSVIRPPVAALWG